MVSVSILALKNCLIASVADARQVFLKVNEFLSVSGKEPLFKVTLVWTSNEVSLTNGLFVIHPELTLKQVEKTDLIIIPQMAGDVISATYLNKDFAVWMADQYKNGAEVASLCVGAFLLAYSGILKGKYCTTHASYATNSDIITHQSPL